MLFDVRCGQEGYQSNHGIFCLQSWWFCVP